MIDSEQDPFVEWIVREAKRPVVTDLGARERVMSAVRAEPVPVRRSGIARLLSRVREPRVFIMSPAGSALLAAGLVGIGVLAGNFLTNRDGRATVGQRSVAAVPQLPVSDTVVEFVLIAPQAAKVSVVGDFNNWDATKTPMAPAANHGVWTVTLPMTVGRHLYAYVVDGTSWIADPNAPLAPDDGFGHANSVKIVRRGSAL